MGYVLFYVTELNIWVGFELGCLLSFITNKLFLDEAVHSEAFIILRRFALYPLPRPSTAFIAPN